MSIEPNAVELRILGCLVEKQRTTPDQYPLSVNAIRNACNQSTNRDPVVDYDERTVLDALERLSRRRWVRLTSGAGSRARKYRHLIDTELSLARDEIAVRRGPDAARAADPGRAEAAHRAPAPVRGPGGDRRRARAADRPRAGRTAGAPAGAEGSALPAAARRRGRRGAGARRRSAPRRPRPIRSSGAGPDRLERVERELTELRDEVARLACRAAPPRD